jgi:transcriptional regulator with XRE-family HTH domain
MQNAQAQTQKGEIRLRILDFLEKNDISRSKFSEAIGVSITAISDWGKKKTNPQSDKIFAIADFLNVSTDWVLTGEEKNPRISNTETCKRTTA